MALVPSGHFKFMQTQQFKTAQSLNDPNLFQQNAQERDNIEQQQVGESSQPAAQPQTQPAPVAETPAVPSEEIVEPQGTDQVNTPEDINETKEQATTMKAHIFKVLESIGVPRRQLEDIDKQLFGQEINLDDKTISGHYMIPTFTANGAIDERKAQEIAQAIGKQFALSQKMKINGRNWRVDFRSAPKQELMQGGSSFDELQGQGNQPHSKAAFTLPELLKERRGFLFKEIQKFAKKKV